MFENWILFNRLKDEFRSLEANSEIGIALLTVKGKVLYSEFSSDINDKFEQYKPSYSSLAVGSNIILAGEDVSLIVIRTTEHILMALQAPQQYVSSILTMSPSIIKKYENELEKMF